MPRRGHTPTTREERDRHNRVREWQYAADGLGTAVGSMSKLVGWHEPRGHDRSEERALAHEIQPLAIKVHRRWLELLWTCRCKECEAHLLKRPPHETVFSDPTIRWPDRRPGPEGPIDQEDLVPPPILQEVQEEVQQRTDDGRPFTVQDLGTRGFSGFVPVHRLGPDPGEVPSLSGVYVVIRTTDAPPEYRETSPGSWFKGKNPTVSISELAKQWVLGATTLYFGSGVDLRARVGLLADFSRGGRSSSVFHWGGRLLWQLKDAQDLQVAWKEVPPDHHKTEQRDLVDEFEAAFDSMPFANLRKPPRN